MRVTDPVGARFIAPCFFALLLLLSAAASAAPPNPAARVLLIVNDNSAASRTIGAFYALKRHVPAGHIVHLRCPEAEEVDESAFNVTILAPVANALSKDTLSDTIDFLVLTKGVPLRVRSTEPAEGPYNPNGDSVDGRLMMQDIAGLRSPSRNPFFNSQVRFSRAAFHFYLATRLDGYTVADAEALVTRSLAARPAKGTFLLDGAPSRNGGGDPTKLNAGLDDAARILQSRGLSVLLDQSLTFVGRIPNLMGYWSWGSNDPQFDAALYKGNTWRPGAIAETVVSTSARTMLPTVGGQSLIADLVASGVTGVKGYVSEPYTLAMARPEVLFDRYTRGWNLAEAFYCASPVLHWKDVVLGDPLCAPYATPPQTLPRKAARHTAPRG